MSWEGITGSFGVKNSIFLVTVRVHSSLLFVIALLHIISIEDPNLPKLSTKLLNYNFINAKSVLQKPFAQWETQFPDSKNIFSESALVNYYLQKKLFVSYKGNLWF